MEIKGKNSLQSLAVAIAVLRFGDEFLLATRHAHSHQGGKLEFIGGKIEPDETPKMALIREVAEELGLDIRENTADKMGQICHDYGDKVVDLHVYQVTLTQRQYDVFCHQTVGLDDQALLWLDKDTLLGSMDRLPDANRQILTWLDERG